MEPQDSEVNASSLKERARAKLARNMGSLLVTALNNPQTVEIMVNADGRIWQEKLGESMACIGDLRPAQTEAIIKTVAGFHSKEVTKLKPIIEGEFPLDGSRFAGQLPPIVTSPTFAIRKKAVAIFTLEQYRDQRTMTDKQYNKLKSAIENHLNILVVGGTGSGKTTLVNAIINEMVMNDPSERIFIIEDTDTLYLYT